MVLENLGEGCLLLGIINEQMDTIGSKSVKVSRILNFVSIFENKGYVHRNIFFPCNIWYK